MTSSQSPTDTELLLNHTDLIDSNLIDRFKSIYPVDSWKQLGLFDDSYLSFINEHWLKYPPQDRLTHRFLGYIYIVIMVIGFSGNGLVLLMFIRCRSLRTPGNKLIANLALSDLLMVSKAPLLIINSFYEGPALGNLGCSIYGFVGGFSGVTTISLLTAIAYDRYSVVVRPLDPLKNLNNKRAKMFVASGWLYAFSFSVVPLLNIGVSRYVPEGYLTSCSFNYLSDAMNDKIFIIAFFCAGWVLPFLVISYCYVSIFSVVINNRMSCESNVLSARHVKEQTVKKGEVKLAGLVIVVILLFFVSWTPYGVITLLGVFDFKELVTPTSSMIPALFCKTASCVNPFIYLISHPKFRAEFEKMFCNKNKISQAKTVKRPMDMTKTNALKDEDIEIIQLRDIPQAREVFRSVSDTQCHRQKMLKLTKQLSFDSDSFEQPPSWYKQPFPKNRFM